MRTNITWGSVSLPPFLLERENVKQDFNAFASLLKPKYVDRIFNNPWTIKKFLNFPAWPI